VAVCIPVEDGVCEAVVVGVTREVQVLDGVTEAVTVLEGVFVELRDAVCVTV
jgi:hypothetical protein